MEPGALKLWNQGCLAYALNEKTKMSELPTSKSKAPGATGCC